MPELAEVYFYRKQWVAARGQSVREVLLNADARVFRDTDTGQLRDALEGACLGKSWQVGKQMLFHFGEKGWLGVHLGMAGRLRQRAADHAPDKHDHLCLRMEDCTLVFVDYRMFGRVRFDHGSEPPAWWQKLPAPLCAETLTADGLRELCHGRTVAVKSLLLQQEHFPGIGNWMADEILWRAKIHPAAEAGDLSKSQVQALRGALFEVIDAALDVIGDDATAKPEDWLIAHRKKGGHCPRTGKPVKKCTVGGRSTYFVPAVQE